MTEPLHSPLPPPGWYPDDAGPGLERWWDGREWSAVTRDAPTAAEAGGAPAETGGAPVTGPVPPSGVYPGPWPAGPPGGTAAFGDRPAGVLSSGERAVLWVRRVVARLIDVGICYVIVAVVGWRSAEDLSERMRAHIDWVATSSGGRTPQFDVNGLAADSVFLEARQTVLLLLILVTALYEIVFVALRGATPGKYVLGLRVRRVAGGGVPGWGSSSVRWVVGGFLFIALPLIGPVFWLLDVLFPLGDGRGQALHDKAARTVVVPVRR